MTKEEKIVELEEAVNESSRLLGLEQLNLEALTESIRISEDMIASYEVEIDRLEATIEVLKSLG